MGVVIGGLEFYAGPETLHAPDDLEAVIIDFLAEARHSLCIAVQEIDSQLVAEAIVAAERRGVRVKVILEGDYLLEEKSRADPWVAAGSHEQNRRIHDGFLRAGIDVISDLNPAIFHQKFIVRDPEHASRAVLTGSANFTLTDTGKDTSTGRVRGNNLNHLVVLHSRSATNQYQAEFNRLRQGTFGDLHERIEAKPAEFRLGGVRVKPLFAPRHGPEMEIMKQMLKSRDRIDFAMFTFAQSSGIDDVMRRLTASGTRIRGVLDRGQGNATWAASKGLTESGVEVFMNRTDTGVRKVHHKLMVIDEQLTIVGSFNYTGPANTFNDENIIVIGNLEEEVEEARTRQRAIARYALDEIDRIILEHCEAFRPIPVPA